MRNTASQIQLQNSDGRVEPPSSDVSTLTMLWELDPPPQANRKYTTGMPPARMVKPPAKLWVRLSKLTFPRVSATLPWSARKLKPKGPQIECSKLSRISKRFGARKR